MRFRIRKAVLLLAFISLISALTGRFILPLLGFSPKPGLMSFLSGLAATALFWQAVVALSALKANVEKEKQLSGRFPQSVQELRAMGVETELDFIQVVRAFLAYSSHPYVAGDRGSDRTVALPALFRRSVAMFEEMFGRAPEGSGTGDWDIICRIEIRRAFGREMEDVSEEEFQARLSGKLKDHFHRMNKDTKKAAAE